MWQLKINAKVMICSEVPLSSQFTFYIYGKGIQIVSSLKYLGLVLESNGSNLLSLY